MRDATADDGDLPYDSEGAFHRAYDNGADGIKTDFRVASDGVAMVAHSSPIELWESLDCAGQKIEEHTSTELAGCHLLPSSDQTSQRVGDVLDWARGKLTIMLTVKDKDFGAAITTILAHDAAAYTFIEVRLGDLQTIVAALPAEQRDAVYYNAELGSEADLPALLALNNPRVLMVELDDYDGSTIASTITDVIHPAGMRAFVQAQYELGEQAQRALFDLGFDVDMSCSLVNGVAARKAVNTARGVSPP